MDFIAKNTDINKLKTQCAVVFACDQTLLASGQAVDEKHAGILSKTLKSKDIENSAGQSAWITVPSTGKSQGYERVLLVQLGKSSSRKATSISLADWRKVCAAMAGSVQKSAAKDAAVFIDELSLDDEDNSSESLSSALAQSFEAAAYRYSSTKAKVSSPALKKVSVICSEQAKAKAGLALGKAVGEGMNTARELGNLPGNICTPTYLADLAKTFAKDCAKLTTKVLTEKQMEKLGMHSLLSVSRGSDEEAKLIIMEYKNAAKTTKPNVIVGKGITFDTGGISLKPGAAMDEMKFDMCGAASVFGSMKTLMALNAKVNVVAIVAASENMPSGKATKPGDIVTSMSGQTIEILNTDAEGRLVLCDALTYAERYKPKSVVDIATLTGACVISLGSHATGLFSNNDELAQALLDSGEKTNDRAWRMPIWDEYQKQLDSNFADMANIGGREAGSITAACFLSRYTKSYPWAHLDIAGTAWHSGAKKGATGRPVPLLVNYLLNN